MLDRLVSTLKVKSKIILLLVVFSIPLSILGFYSLDMIHRDIESATHEIDGVREIKQQLSIALRSSDREEIIRVAEKIPEIGVNSGLILDPDLDSYSLQRTLTDILPDISRKIAEASRPETIPTDRLELRAIAMKHLFIDLYEMFDATRKSDVMFNGSLDSLQSLLLEYDRSKDEIQSLLTGCFESVPTNWGGATIRLASMVEKIATELETLIKRRREAVEWQMKLAMFTGMIALVLLPMLSWFIVRNVTSRLGRLFAVTARAAQFGDLSVQVHDHGSDEIFLLSQSFNSMAENLRGMVKKIIHSGSLISTSIAEIAAVARQQQATSSEIAATTTQIEATSKQIARTSEGLALNMKEVQQITINAADLASEGQTSLDRMKSTMQSVTDASIGISQKLEILNQKASRIGDVVTAIAKVADQTNLLSLNAAIEAERAGEYGQGFAVVAREIRRLADQTAVSTLDIEQMVREIQSAVAAGVMGMEKFSNEVRRGATEVAGANEQLSTVIDHIQTLSPTFQTVADGMQSQVLGARQITESLSQLSTAARQTAESLSQSNVSIEQLHQAAVLLDQEVDRFEVEGDVR